MLGPKINKQGQGDGSVGKGPKAADLSRIPRTHMVEERTDPHNIPVTSTCVLWRAFPSTHTRIEKIKKSDCHQ